MLLKSARDFLVAVGLTLLLSASSLLAQDAPSRMTAELLWELGRLGSPAVSPSGEAVVWTVRHYNLAENSGTSNLVVGSVTGGDNRILLQGWKSLGDLQWTEVNGERTLWFVGKHEGIQPDAPQLFCVSEAGLSAEKFEPRQVSHYDDGVSNVKVSPDGKHFALTKEIKLDQTVNELYADLPKADARIIDALMYRHWDSWHDYAYSHLHVAAIDEQGQALEARDLMPGQRNDSPVAPFGGSEQFAWSPNSKTLAYTTKISPNPAESTDSSVWLVDIDSESPARLVTEGRPGYDNDPFWSPDGQVLGFHSMVRPGFEADRNRVLLLELNSGALNEATEGLDQSASGTRFLSDGRLLFASDIDGTVQLFLLSRGGELHQVTGGEFNWGLVEVLPGETSAIVTRQSMLRPDELFRIDLNDPLSEPVAISHVNDSIYASLQLPQIVRRDVTATDGATIRCWVALPPEFDASQNQQWPLLLYCQGGPQSQVSQAFSFRWNFHLMASEGYVVIAPNRRGLPGFGQDWNDQISGDWGGQAMQDLLAATDDISKEPWIDLKRRGAVGASFGGYSVYWLMGNHEGRFSAMIAHCGVFDLESMYGSTEELFFVNWDLNGPYWSSPDAAAKYETFSPHRFIANWETPLLVIHGEKDFRVPVTQGMEAFTAAQVQRIPSRFLYFPTEGHWVTQPQNSVLWQRVFFDWLDRHLAE